MATAFLKRGLVTIYCVLALVLARAGGAYGAVSDQDPVVPRDFSAQVHGRLIELDKEVDNLKSREARLPAEAKDRFRQALQSLGHEWDEARQLSLTLKPKTPLPVREKMQKMISKMEHDIDNVESQFDEKGFGLGGLLGL